MARSFSLQWWLSRRRGLMVGAFVVFLLATGFVLGQLFD
jgi:hypothetical protein